MNQAKDRLKEGGEYLLKGYDLLLERASDALEAIGDKRAPSLRDLLDKAKARAAELGELSAEEGERIMGYVTRDLFDAARHLAEEERDIADWLRLDLLLIEQRLLHRVSLLAEQARIEFKHIKKDPKHPLEWRTGEITGIGTLVCNSCGKSLHFYKTGHIPPCPKCHGVHFHRAGYK